jgi:uncharacterized membrane protein YcfT
VITTGSVAPAAGPLPGPGRLAIAAGIAVLVSLAWGALGWTAGTALNSAVATLTAYTLACFTLPVILTRKRDIL